MDSFSLSDTHLLHGATIGDIDAVQIMSETRQFDGGQQIVAEGDTSGDIMILLEGRASVKTRDGDVLDELRKGDVLGEISFLDGKGRTADVFAVGKVQVLAIPAIRLRAHMKENQKFESILLRNIGLALCRRLREANTQVEALLLPR